MKQDASLTGHELKMAVDEIIVTKTDLDGRIKYGNRTFFRFAGYSEADCIGKQHNIIRHPDMPRSVFKLFWDTLKSGEEIFAYVNNRSKNGDHYWVLAHVSPSRDSSGQVVGYHSNRRAPNQSVLTEVIEPLYDTLLQTERSAASPKEGLALGEKAIQELLAEHKATFNQYIFSLGV